MSSPKELGTHTNRTPQEGFPGWVMNTTHPGCPAYLPSILFIWVISADCEVTMDFARVSAGP
jgi:hypothetical protein